MAGSMELDCLSCLGLWHHLYRYKHSSDRNADVTVKFVFFFFR